MISGGSTASVRPRVLLLTPPFVQLNTPYPATAALTGWLRLKGYDCLQRDLSIEVALEVLRQYGGDEADEFIEILQNPRLDADAKHAAALWMDDLANAIRDEADPDFGFSRYAEHLGVALPDLGLLLRRLRRRTRVDRVLEEKTRAVLESCRPDFVGVTCPFPGTLLGAFRIAQTVRRHAPNVRLVLGGGYVNTELRACTDRRLFRFFDHVLYDEGYAPWLDLLQTGNAPAGAGRRTVRPCTVPPFVKPCYDGLDLKAYIDLPETENPMQRLWSTGRWLKVQLVRGCYWHRCAFCDVTLDYIGNFAMPDVRTVVDALEALRTETGESGFHFTDEAIPPAFARRLSDEIIRRKFRCRWWGNIRFDGAYTPALAKRMARAGCIAVTGGLECAHDRLLALMNKGITCAGARDVLAHFARAGILTHAYLMYGFPTETLAETKAALRYVRDLFREGILASAFFHRFALTVHSPIAANPSAFGIVPGSPPPAGRYGRFALNEIPFSEPNAPDLDWIGRALRLALYNFTDGRGLDRGIDFWFEATRSKRRRQTRASASKSSQNPG